MKKRRLSILLSIVMLLSLLPTTALAADTYPKANEVSVDGGKYFAEPGCYYFKNGATACSKDPKGSNATYDPTTGTLTLDGYNGGSIEVGGTESKITVVLVGKNSINNGSLTSAWGGDITVTSDSSGTLSISKTTSGSNPAIGIETGYGSIPTGNVMIKGNAKVTINMTHNGTKTYDKSYGIYAKENITISENASVDITCATPNNTTGGDYCNGLRAGKNVSIDTNGTIKIDVTKAGKDDGYSFGVYPMGTATLTKVGEMEVKWKKHATHSGYPGAAILNGSGFDTNTHAVNEDTTNCYAFYRFGTPYTVTVKNGNLAGPGVVSYAKNNGNFLAGDTVNIKPDTKTGKSGETIPFKEWTAEGVMLTSPTTKDTSFNVPANAVTVTATYNPFVGTPTFTRESESGGTIAFKTAVKPGDGNEFFQYVKVGEENDSYGYKSIAPQPTTASTAFPYEYSVSATNYNTGGDIKNLEAGDYRMAVTLNSERYLSDPFTVDYTAAVTPTADISLDKTGIVDFDNMEAGYPTAPEAQTVTITNNGTAATGEMTITLDGVNKTDFKLSKTSITDIPASGTDTFTVQPKTGLAAGTHTATVKVSGTGVTAQSFNVQFTVTAPMPSATVGNVTISGTVDQSITDQDVVITLVNDKFKSLPAVGGNVRDLFPDLSGTALIAKLKSVHEDTNRTVLTATISGTANKEINKVMEIVIPADRLESGKALTVTTNPKAKFAIKKVSLPKSLKICKEDDTVVTTDTLTTGSTAQNVKYTAKVYDQYDEMLSGSHTINWDLTPSGALSTTVSNPTPQMNLQLAANANAGTYTLTATLGGTEIKSSITIEVIQPKAGLLTAPTGKTDLKYNGTDQELLATPGAAENGTLRYRVDPSSTGSYSEEMPKAKDTKTYKVWYYVKGNAGYADTAYESIDVKIEKGDVEVSNIKVTSPAEITTDTNINDIKFSCDAVIAGTTREAGGELSLSGGQSLSAGTKEYNLTFLPTLTSDLNVKSFIKYSLTVKAPEHNITVRSDGNGTATASLAKASAGTTITLTATPNAGYHFKAWKVVSGGVTIANESSATTTFTMLAKDVTIEASFEKNASSGSGGSSGGSYVPKTQKPEIKAAAGGKTVLSKDGTTLTITADAGKVIDKVLLNGKDMGAVSELKGLKTGDKVEVIFKDQVTEPTKEELDKAAKEAAGELVLTARSAKLKNGSVKVMLKGDLKAITDAGYTAKYKFYRSTKKTAGYKAVLTKKAPSYVNTYGKKGTMYYYKAKVMIYDKEGNFVAQTALKQCKYANRLWTK